MEVPRTEGLEISHHLLRLVLPHQTGVDMEQMDLLRVQGLEKESPYDGGIYAAGDEEEDLSFSHPAPYSLDSVVYVAFHRPLFLRPADPQREILQNPGTVFAVTDLRVKLQTVEISLPGMHHRRQAVLRFGDDPRIPPELLDAVAVAHP